MQGHPCDTKQEDENEDGIIRVLNLKASKSCSIACFFPSPRGVRPGTLREGKSEN